MSSEYNFGDFLEENFDHLLKTKPQYKKPLISKDIKQIGEKLIKNLPLHQRISARGLINTHFLNPIAIFIIAQDHSSISISDAISIIMTKVNQTKYLFQHNLIKLPELCLGSGLMKVLSYERLVYLREVYHHFDLINTKTMICWYDFYEAIVNQVDYGKYNSLECLINYQSQETIGFKITPNEIK